MKFKIFVSLFLVFYCSMSYADNPIFTIQLKAGQTNFPSNLGLHEPPVLRLFTITNQSPADMTGMLYQAPAYYTVDQTNTTCTTSLNKNKSCVLAIKFNPSRVGNFSGKVKVCGGNGIWCSVMASAISVSVTLNHIFSTEDDTPQTRPFGVIDYNSSKEYSQNFNSLITRVLNTVPTHAEFSFIQHVPSVNETTVPCLQAAQKGVGLNPLILGGGVALCDLMGFATSNAGASSAVSKIFPPYLNFLLATDFPITESTEPANNVDLDALKNQFGTISTNTLVRDVGYVGYVNFLTSYYQQQLNKTYQNCGTSEICPSIFYLPYQLTSGQTVLETWPPPAPLKYWGMSGGGGSGAGYQIQAFMPGSSTHYTLFSGGGGGGAGNTTPENVTSLVVPTLINVGSGGGGGSQFANCFVKNNVNLNGLGLGAGTGAGYSTNQGTNISFQVAPPVDYSYYAPLSNPSWSHPVILDNYVEDLSYLFNTLIPQLYNAGYTITITGGGGGGAGLEFLNALGNEFQPHPLSVGYGFNFCYVFNKNNQFNANDCISSDTVGAESNKLNNIIYQNLGNFYNQGMALAILPDNCNGYSNFNCTCKFQNAYVICQLDNVLTENGFTSAAIPTWLINPHCNANQGDLIVSATMIDQYQQNHSTLTTPSCQSAIQRFVQVKNTGVCTPPWGT